MAGGVPLPLEFAKEFEGDIAKAINDQDPAHSGLTWVGLKGALCEIARSRFDYPDEVVNADIWGRILYRYYQWINN
jgi:hypothetical protein